jgi:hypothetical protein
MAKKAAMKSGGKVKCATGGKVKKPAFKKGGVVRGMGAAKRGGKFSGVK